MAEEENVKVAVRVRPFNKREKDRKAKNIVKMKNNITTVTNPEKGDTRNYTYDHSYWSFDGFKEKSNGFLEQDPSHANGKIYDDQTKVYNDLGKSVLENAWRGYNGTLFAYGQTGSGKSYSIIGYDENKGIVPLLCEELFKGINSSKEEKEFEVRFSMLEIYREAVQDLLSQSDKKDGLKVRQHPKKGFYAEDLLNPVVTSYKDINRKMEQGNKKRTIRSTNMNETSSRAHTIVEITFLQKFKNPRGEDTTKSSSINLVDLAGSERVDSTGATGDRLKEGASINLSLTALGNCINALARQSRGENTRIPFRDSTITKLLKNALGGNSKTIVIAAISPADINYSETVSTLIFADKAKQIKTKATVNEDPTEKLIRELKMENEVLKKQLQGGTINTQIVDHDGDGIDDRDAAKLRKEWEEEVKARMKENEMEVKNMKKTYEEKLKATQLAVDPETAKLEKDKKTKPHLMNLNMDPMLSKRIVHIMKPTVTTIGNQKGEISDIKMVGPSIQEQHAEITINKDKSVSIQPVNDDCRLLVNGNHIAAETVLSHNDRIVFGSTQIWLYQYPGQKGTSKMPEITYDYAQEEIAAKFDIADTISDSKDYSEIQSELLDVIPAIEEANAISEELDKKVKFEIMIVSAQMRGEASGKSEVKVKMKHFEHGTEFMWIKEKFMARHFEMKEMYRKYSQEEELSDGWGESEELTDPFAESLETEIDIGQVYLHLQSIAHKVEIKEKLEIGCIKGQELGILNVEIIPCDKKGKEFSENDDIFVNKPEDLLGQELNFVLKILSGRALPRRYRDIYCTYKFYLDKESIETKKVSDSSNPNFNHKKKFSFPKVTKQLIEYLTKQKLIIHIKGKQNVRASAIHLANGLSTRDMLKKDRAIFSKTADLLNKGFSIEGRVVDPQKQSIIVELLLMKKTQARMQLRLDNVMKLVKEAENTSRLRVSTTFLKDVMNASTADQADSMIRSRFTG